MAAAGTLVIVTSPLLARHKAIASGVVVLFALLADVVGFTHLLID
jgi:hypothetical protein